MGMTIKAHKYRRLKPSDTASITGAVITAPTITAPTITGTSTIGAGMTITTPTIVSAINKVLVTPLTATTILVAADSGSVLTLGTAGGFDTKLPAPATGLNFKFVVKVAPTTAYTITTNGITQNVIHGMTLTPQDAGGSGDSTAGTPVDVITFAANKALIGDEVNLVCDGTLWYALAHAKAFDGITYD